MDFRTVWVELPAQDAKRAAKFYGALFDQEFEVGTDGTRRIATIGNMEDHGVGASITQVENFEPSGSKGPFIYIAAGADLEGMLAKVKSAGGKVLAERTPMGDFGSYATFEDTEGNVIAFYASNS